MMLLALLLQGAAQSTAPGTVPSAAPVPLPWAVTRTIARGAPATTTSVWSADGKARLVVRCDTATDPIVSLQFIPKGGFPPATERPVSINIDDGGWLGSNWQFPGTGAFISDDVIVTNLAAMLAHGRSVRVRVTGPDDAPVEAVFAGPPGDAPVRAVLTACGYELGKTPARSMARQAAPADAQPVASEDP